MPMPTQKPGRSFQAYRTPVDFLTAVRHRLGIVDFDIDLAADEDNAVCDLYYDVECDGLKQPWKVGDGWNWLNPEFGDIEPWVERAFCQLITEGARTAVLVPSSTGSLWWAAWVHHCCQILLLRPRLSFDGRHPYPKDCSLLLYAPDAPRDYDLWDWRQP